MGMRWVWSLGGLSLKELGRRVCREIDKDDVFDRAAQLSYFFLLSLFPLLLVLSSIAAGAFSSQPDLYERILSYLRTAMPAVAFELVNATMQDLRNADRGGVLSLGIVLTLWSASVGMEALIKGLNAAFDVREFRPWWKRRLLAIVLTLALALLFLASLILLLAGGWIGQWLADRFRVGGAFQVLWALTRGAAMVVITLVAMNLIYLFAPNLREHRWQPVMPGALVALAAWIAGSAALKIYLNHFDTYAKIYGSVGAVIVLLLWLYLTGVAILVGGEVNSEIRKAAAEAGAPDAQEPLEEPAE
jgi:membrane protein